MKKYAGKINRKSKRKIMKDSDLRFYKVMEVLTSLFGSENRLRRANFLVTFKQRKLNV